MSKSQQKRICTQTECAYRDELETELKQCRAVYVAAENYMKKFVSDGLGDRSLWPKELVAIAEALE